MPNNTLQRTNLQLYRLGWDMDSFPGGNRYHAIMPTTAFATKIFEKEKRNKSNVQPAGNLWPALMALIMAWTFHAEQQQNTHHREPKPWQMTSNLNINVEILPDSLCGEVFWIFKISWWSSGFHLGPHTMEAPRLAWCEKNRHEMLLAANEDTEIASNCQKKEQKSVATGSFPMMQLFSRSIHWG